MRISWKTRRAEIPHKVQIGKRIYEIVWVSDFADGKTLGETRFDPPQIALKTEESDKETVKTYSHEILHAISHEEGANLTENQVLALENSIPYLLKPQNIFVSKK
jgi:hypothetical protein